MLQICLYVIFSLSLYFLFDRAKICQIYYEKQILFNIYFIVFHCISGVYDMFKYRIGLLLLGNFFEHLQSSVSQLFQFQIVILFMSNCNSYFLNSLQKKSVQLSRDALSIMHYQFISLPMYRERCIASPSLPWRICMIMQAQLRLDQLKTIYMYSAEHH